MNKPVFYNKPKFVEYIQTNTNDKELIDMVNSIHEELDGYRFNVVISNIDDEFNYELNYYSSREKKHLLPYKILTGDLKRILKDFLIDINKLII